MNGQVPLRHGGICDYGFTMHVWLPIIARLRVSIDRRTGSGARLQMIRPVQRHEGGDERHIAQERQGVRCRGGLCGGVLHC